MGPLVEQGAALAIEMAQREKDRQALAAAYNPPAPASMPSEPLRPQTAHLVGSLMDAAGTYAGMKARKGYEANPLINAVARQNPEASGLMVLASSLGERGLLALLRKKMPRAANAIQSNLGAQQMSLGANWGRLLMGDHPGDGFDDHRNMMNRWGEERRKR